MIKKLLFITFLVICCAGILFFSLVKMLWMSAIIMFVGMIIGFLLDRWW